MERREEIFRLLMREINYENNQITLGIAHV